MIPYFYVKYMLTLKGMVYDAHFFGHGCDLYQFQNFQIFLILLANKPKASWPSGASGSPQRGELDSNKIWLTGFMKQLCSNINVVRTPLFLSLWLLKILTRQ